MIRRISIALALFVAAVVGSPHTSSQVDAAFSACNLNSRSKSWYGHTIAGAETQCLINTGPSWASYRIVITCGRAGYSNVVIAGPWRSTPSWSVAWCEGLPGNDWLWRKVAPSYRQESP